MLQMLEDIKQKYHQMILKLKIFYFLIKRIKKKKIIILERKIIY